MPPGRPPRPDDTIDQLDGHDAEKLRLEVILAQMHGECTVEEACAKLGIGRSRYFVLRAKALQGALDALTPGASGRPPQPGEEPEVEELRERVGDLEDDLHRTEVQLDLARSDPSVLADASTKKGDPVESARRKLRRQQRRSRQRNRKGR